MPCHRLRLTVVLPLWMLPSTDASIIIPVIRHPNNDVTLFHRVLTSYEAVLKSCLLMNSMISGRYIQGGNNVAFRNVSMSSADASIRCVDAGRSNEEFDASRSILKMCITQFPRTCSAETLSIIATISPGRDRKGL